MLYRQANLAQRTFLSAFDRKDALAILFGEPGTHARPQLCSQDWQRSRLSRGAAVILVSPVVMDPRAVHLPDPIGPAEQASKTQVH